MSPEMQSYFDSLRRCLLARPGKIPTDARTLATAFACERDPMIFVRDMGHLVAMLGDPDVLEFDAALVDLVRAHPELIEHAKLIIADALRHEAEGAPS